MAKLTFIFGTMGSAKTAQALIKRYDYIENNIKVLLLKPSIDNRNKIGYVTSRAGNLSAECFVYSLKTNIIENFKKNIIETDVVIVDEVQFSTKNQIEDLKIITEKYNKPVYAYGLRTDFQTNLFEGSKRLFELADEIIGLKSVCFCKEYAIVNARYENNNIVYSGKQIEIGGEEKYKGLCYSCYKKNKIK